MIGITWVVGNLNWKLYFDGYKQAKEFYLEQNKLDDSIKFYYC